MFAAFKELFFPSLCCACQRYLSGDSLPLLCFDCLAQIVPVSPPFCPDCGLPFAAGTSHLCGACLRQKSPADLIRSALLYQKPVSTLIHQLKYGGQMTMLDTFAELVRQANGNSDISAPDLVLPVPLHIDRLRERGFNQAVLLARYCFPAWRQRIVSDLLIRKIPTESQSGLSGAARRRNLTGAFAVNDHRRLAGKKVLLVDDVFTTGSTVYACSKVLRKAGVQRIEVFTLARAV